MHQGITGFSDSPSALRKQNMFLATSALAFPDPAIIRRELREAGVSLVLWDDWGKGKNSVWWIALSFLSWEQRECTRETIVGMIKA